MDKLKYVLLYRSPYSISYCIFSIEKFRQGLRKETNYTKDKDIDEAILDDRYHGYIKIFYK